MRAESKIILGLLSCLIMCASCKKADEQSNEEALRQQYYNLEKIGWKSKKYIQKSATISFTATEVPIQYYLLKDQGNENLELIDSIYHENKTERIIEFAFQQDEEKDLLAKDFTGLDYDDAVKYMSFGLEKDFYAVTSKMDTIQCAGVTFERNFKVAPYQKVMLFFSGIQPDEKIQLVYTDHLFKQGILKFKFKDTYTQIAL